MEKTEVELFHAYTSKSEPNQVIYPIDIFIEKNLAFDDKRACHILDIDFTFSCNHNGGQTNMRLFKSGYWKRVEPGLEYNRMAIRVAFEGFVDNDT